MFLALGRLKRGVVEVHALALMRYAARNNEPRSRREQHHQRKERTMAIG